MKKIITFKTTPEAMLIYLLITALNYIVSMKNLK